MRLVVHICRVLADVVSFGVVNHRLAVVALVAIGLLLVGLTLVVQVAAPLALYPFA